MKSVPLTVYPRTAARRGGVKRLRSAGRIPAVMYGRNTKPVSLEIKLKDLELLIHHSASENVLVDLTVGDAKDKKLALVQEVQHQSLSGKILHVDFHEVAPDEKVTITVPVESVGEATGVKNGGGILEHVMFKLRVRALPKDLPEALHVDVSSLEIGKAIHLGDIQPPAGVEILGDKKLTVLSVAAPITEAQEAEAAAAGPQAAGDVEMTKEKKDAEAAPAAAGGDKAAAGGDKAAEKKPAEKKK